MKDDNIKMVEELAEEASELATKLQMLHDAMCYNKEEAYPKRNRMLMVDTGSSEE